jgi:hypothetical protein
VRNSHYMQATKRETYQTTKESMTDSQIRVPRKQKGKKDFQFLMISINILQHQSKLKDSLIRIFRSTKQNKEQQLSKEGKTMCVFEHARKCMCVRVPAFMGVMCAISMHSKKT